MALRHPERVRSYLPLMVLMVMVTLVAWLSVGCASTRVTELDRTAPNLLPKPNRFLVYDVVATLNDLPADSELRPLLSANAKEQTQKEIATGRELGSLIAHEIAERLRDLGLPAVRARDDGKERIDDVAVRGGFVEIDKGNMALRVLVGFGAGGNELHTHFEVYQVASYGRVPLGTANIEAAGGHMPGVLLSMGVGGVAKGIAVGGTLAAGKEFTSESLEGAAVRTAKEFMEAVEPGLRKRGWIPED